MSDGWRNREYVERRGLSLLGHWPTIRPPADTPGAGPLLPWPSLGWQQAALAGAVVLGAIVAFAGFSSIDGSEGLVGGVVWGLIGIALATMALYSGWTTRWLTNTWMAPLPAKVAGGVAIGLVTALAVIAIGGAMLLWVAMLFTAAITGWVVWDQQD